MTQPKFTPGPWNFHSSYPLESEVITVAASEDGTHASFDSWSTSISSGDLIIADAMMRTATGGWPHVTDLEEARANAALIAAAPDMYAALEGLLDRPNSAARLLAAAEALTKAGRA